MTRSWMGKHRYSISIAAPPEAVYDLFSDPDRHAEWESGNPRVTNRSASSLQPGTTYQLRHCGASRAAAEARGQLNHHPRPVEAHGAHGYATALNGASALHPLAPDECVHDGERPRAPQLDAL